MKWWLVLPLLFGTSIAAEKSDGLKMALALRPKITITAAIDESLAPELTKMQVSSDVELLLRQNNIPVVTEAGEGALVVYVKTARFEFKGASIYAVLTEVDYLENVAPDAALAACLPHDGEKISWMTFDDCRNQHLVFASLWRKDDVLQVGEHRVSEIRTRIKDLVQQFAIEYLRASDPRR